MRKILTLAALLALLLVSTAILAEGRPTGLRIGKAEGSGGSTTPTAAIDITVTGTNGNYGCCDYTIFLNNTVLSVSFGYYVPQFVSGSFAERLPQAIDWGDGDYSNIALLFGPASGPWTGRFTHTYAVPGTYTITVGDAVYGGYYTVNTGNRISGYERYFYDFFGSAYATFGPFDTARLLAITATTVITTGFGIPTLNVYGLLAMAFVLVGAGLLVYRGPQDSAV